MIKNKNSILFLIIILIIFSWVKSSQAADPTQDSWQQTLSSNFDWADTFNSWNDWTPNGYFGGGMGWNGNFRYGDDSGTTWPSLTTGKATPELSWHGYSNWSGSHPPLVIGNFNNICVGNGGKCYRRDEGNVARIATYFGNGITVSGYQNEIYIFLRVYAPVGYFGKSGSAYLNCDYYGDYGYLKFITIGSGFVACSNYGHTDESGGAFEFDYGFNPKFFNYWATSNGGLGMVNIVRYANSGCSDYDWMSENYWSDSWTGTLSNTEGRWIGLEFYVLNGNNGDGAMRIRGYNESGNRIFENNYTNVTTNAGCGDWWNHLLLGGNRGESCHFGSDYLYYDDVVVDGAEIAPKYYAYLTSGSDNSSPAAPSGLSVN